MSFLTSCLYSTMRLTRVREWRFYKKYLLLLVLLLFSAVIIICGVCLVCVYTEIKVHSPVNPGLSKVPFF